MQIVARFVAAIIRSLDMTVLIGGMLAHVWIHWGEMGCLWKRSFTEICPLHSRGGLHYALHAQTASKNIVAIWHLYLFDSIPQRSKTIFKITVECVTVGSIPTDVAWVCCSKEKGSSSASIFRQIGIKKVLLSGVYDIACTLKNYFYMGPYTPNLNSLISMVLN